MVSGSIPDCNLGYRHIYRRFSSLGFQLGFFCEWLSQAHLSFPANLGLRTVSDVFPCQALRIQQEHPKPPNHTVLSRLGTDFTKG